MTKYKVVITSKNSFFNEGNASNIDNLRIIVMTMIPNLSKNMLTRIEKWAKTAKNNDIYKPSKRKFYIKKIEN